MAALEKLIITDQNYKVLREVMKKAEPPSIPYLGLSLTDLTMIDEGNPHLHGNLFNFTKRMAIYNVISNLQSFQHKPYAFKPVESIAKFLREIPTQEEKSYNKRLWDVSLQYEPRGAEKVF